VLQSGGPSHAEGLIALTESAYPSPIGPLRMVPLLRWDRIEQMIMCEEPSRLIHAETLLETDVPGKRTFALQVRDDSMQPLFSEGEIIFVNPDLRTEPGHDVVVASEDRRPKEVLVRQRKAIDGRPISHPLSRRYEDISVTNQQRVVGRVVRMRKNL
jgi:SOS-response transcriptional repressor LexA